jgi:predicted DNA-binding ArsR family transcriptional regulator
LDRIAKSEDYRQHLKPLLEAQFNNKWLSPEQFPTLKEFHKAYVEVQKRAEAYKEVRDVIEAAETNIINVTKQLNEPEKNFEL